MDDRDNEALSWGALPSLRDLAAILLIAEAVFLLAVLPWVR